MKLGLINSAWLGSPVGTAEGIHQTKEIGFDTIDIFADPLEIDIKERRLIKDTCREVGLPVISVCCCALGIADFNEPVRRFHVERAKKHLELVYELEAKNLLLVLGEYIWQQEVIAPHDQWKWAVETVSELGDYAAGLGRRNRHRARTFPPVHYQYARQDGELFERRPPSRGARQSGYLAPGAGPHPSGRDSEPPGPHRPRALFRLRRKEARRFAAGTRSGGFPALSRSN